MITAQDDLKLLRDEQDRLSKMITRFAVVHMVVLAFIVFGFARALHKIDYDNLANALTRIDNLAHITGQNSWTLKCNPLDELYPLNYLFKPKEFPSQRISESRGYSSQERADALTEQKSLAKQVRTLCDDAFSSEVGLEGAKIRLDVRNLISIYPFLFILGQIYLHLLRKKRNLVAMAASAIVGRVRESGQDTIARLDMFLYSGKIHETTSYTKYPGRILEYIYASVLIFILLYFYSVLRPLISVVRFSEFLPARAWLLMSLISYYSVTYFLHVSKKLEDQVSSNICFLGASRYQPSIIRNVGEKAAQFFTRLRPRFALFSGSTMVLLTLFLALSLSARGCELQAVKGNDIVVGHDDNANRAEWITPLLIEKTPSSVSHQHVFDAYKAAPRVLYIIALIIAVFSLLFVLMSVWHDDVLHHEGTNKLLFQLISSLLLFFVADYGSAFVDSLYWKITVLFSFWLIPTLLAIPIALCQTGHAADWLKSRIDLVRRIIFIRPMLLVSFPPIVFLLYFACSESAYFSNFDVGMSSLMIGLLLMSSAYKRLQ